MKYILDGETGMTQPYTEAGHTSDVIEAVCRLKEELEGWEMYCRMAKVKKHDTYSRLSFQEFQHALVACDDLMHAIKAQATPEEIAELAKFSTAITG